VLHFLLHLKPGIHAIGSYACTKIHSSIAVVSNVSIGLLWGEQGCANSFKSRKVALMKVLCTLDYRKNHVNKIHALLCVISIWNTIRRQVDLPIVLEVGDGENVIL
jgi:hypothetical protein